ncbi:hypothetical protein Tco_1070815, partial [Tanacetum coccineum]
TGFERSLDTLFMAADFDFEKSFFASESEKHVNTALGLNDTTPRVAKEVVSPSVVDDTLEKEKLSHVVTTTESYLPLPTHVTTLAGNAPGKSSYANVTGKPSGKKLNFCTLFTPGGNGIDVVVPVESIRTVSERFTNTKYGFFLGKAGGIPCCC